MASTIRVRALTRDRKVVLSEYDESHPTPNHEIWIVGYEEPRFDADGNEVVPSNAVIEVGDTPGVRQCISEKTLEIVNGGSQQPPQVEELPPPAPVKSR
jgi:hypothetical protein